MRIEDGELSEEVETLTRLIAYLVYLLGGRVDVKDSSLDEIGGVLSMSPIEGGARISLETDSPGDS